MGSVLSAIRSWFYALPIWQAVTISFACAIVWTLLCKTLEKRNKTGLRILSASCFAAAIAVIAASTLLREQMGRQLDLRPFYTVIRAQKNLEAYRSALMNVILFLPIGCTLAQLFPSRWRSSRLILMTGAVALCISVLLETLQYFLCVGLAETDDVIFNTVGALLGAAHILFIKRTDR